jgi:hypothetical protein
MGRHRADAGAGSLLGARWIARRKKFLGRPMDFSGCLNSLYGPGREFGLPESF